MSIPHQQSATGCSGGIAPNALAPETTSRFEWNGRTIGIAVGASILVITCVTLGILVNPAFFAPLSPILPFAWLLMDSPTLNDLQCSSRTIPPEQ